MNTDNNTQPGQAEQPADTASFDPAKLEAVVNRLKSEQNLALAIAAGIAGAIVAAFAWAGITVASGYQIGFMAIAVGAVVGLLVRYAGKGLDKQFGIAGGVLALLGCGLGNALVVIAFMAQGFGLSYQEVFAVLDLPTMVEMMRGTFSAMDLLFYALAVYTAYRLSFRKLGQDDLAEAVATPE